MSASVHVCLNISDLGSVTHMALHFLHAASATPVGAGGCEHSEGEGLQKLHACCTHESLCLGCADLLAAPAQHDVAGRRLQVL